MTRPETGDLFSTSSANARHTLYSRAPRTTDQVGNQTSEGHDVLPTSTGKSPVPLPLTMTARLLVILFFPLIVSGFRVQVDVPSIILTPSPAWLNCSAKNLGSTESIDSVHWFKDDEEFYAYSAIDGKASQKSMFGKGIVDVDERSNAGHIFLPQTNVNTTGCYKCIIKLTDGRVKDQEKKITSIYLPVGRGFPLIEVGPKSPEDFDTYAQMPVVIVSLGQEVTVNCTSRPSSPAAKIGIKVNGVISTNMKRTERQDTLYESVEGTTYQNILYRSFVSGKFRVTEDMVSKRFVRVSCSSVLSLPESHGFLDQEDSDSVRIRVVQENKPLITTVAKRKRREMIIFYSFFIVTGVLLFLNFLVQRRYNRQEAKRAELINRADDESDHRSASFANQGSHPTTDNNNDTSGKKDDRQTFNQSQVI